MFIKKLKNKPEHDKPDDFCVYRIVTWWAHWQNTCERPAQNLSFNITKHPLLLYHLWFFTEMTLYLFWTNYNVKLFCLLPRILGGIQRPLNIVITCFLIRKTIKYIIHPYLSSLFLFLMILRIVECTYQRCRNHWNNIIKCEQHEIITAKKSILL